MKQICVRYHYQCFLPLTFTSPKHPKPFQHEAMGQVPVPLAKSVWHCFLSPTAIIFIYLGLQNITYVQQTSQASVAWMPKAGLGGSSSTPLLAFEDVISPWLPKSKGWISAQCPGRTAPRASTETALLHPTKCLKALM